MELVLDGRLGWGCGGRIKVQGGNVNQAMTTESWRGYSGQLGEPGRSARKSHAYHKLQSRRIGIFKALSVQFGIGRSPNL